MKVFISPSAEGAWTIDPQRLATALRARCPLVHVIDVSDAAVAHCLEWTWPARNGPVEGSLDAACSTVVLDGGIDDCAGFAVWFRALVQDVQELAFYDESYSASVTLRSQTTVEELSAPFVVYDSGRAATGTASAAGGNGRHQEG